MMSGALPLSNIGLRGQRQRRIVGLIGFALAAALLVALDQLAANRWWRLAGFPLIWFGTLGVMQAHARTCVALAARRTCDAELADRGLTDADAEILARRGRAILRRATILAAAVTLLLLTLPTFSAR
jgi:hypothetical protein